MNRRAAVHLIARAAAGVSLSSLASAEEKSVVAAISPADDAFLDDLERRGCLYFVEQASTTTGQVLDRAKARNTTGARDPRTTASIAATGFGLTALCIADKRGYQPTAKMREQVRRTLRFHANELVHEHGFFYHFNNVDNNQPKTWSEVSSIDTAILLCGVLTARAHFSGDAEIVRLATSIYTRVDWPWFLNGGATFSMGWGRDSGFLTLRWDHYCELMMLPLLAIASPTHPIDASAWYAWSRPKTLYHRFAYIGGPDPLFVHQYSHAWFDFRKKRDRYANYFTNSIWATGAHEVFCQNLGHPYSLDYWGVTASDSRFGYHAWGGPPMFGNVDGSVVPCATAGSLPFRPLDCLRVLQSLKANFGSAAWGRYGFCDAFHPDAKWYDEDVVGIDLGIGVLMAENLRSGFVWDTFSRNPEVSQAFQKAGFRAAL